MKALVAVVSVVFLLALAEAENVLAGGPTLNALHVSRLSPADITVSPGDTGVMAGIFRITAGPDTLPDVVVVLFNAGLPPQLNPVSKIYVVYPGGGTTSDDNPPVNTGASIYFGTIPASQFRDFIVRIDIHPLATGSILLGVRDESSVRLGGGGSLIVSGDFPVWGNVVKVVELPPPIPTSVWLHWSGLNGPTDTTYVYMGLASEGAGANLSVRFVSATITVSSEMLAPILYAKIGGYQSSSDWVIIQNALGAGILNIAMAGTTPLEPEAQPFIVLAFNTSIMRLGNRADFNIKIRFNEEPEQSIDDRIDFFGLPGDVTVNGEVSSLDAAAILRYSVGIKDVYDGLILPVADVSGNGEITAYDASLILQFVAGIIPAFPPRPSTSKGGVGGGGSTAVGKIVAGESLVTRGKTRIEGGKHVIPILVSEPAMAGELEIGPVDDSVEVVPGDIIKEATFLANRIGNKIKVAFAGSDQPAEGGELLLLKFDPEPKPFKVQARINEGPVQTLSTAVEAKSWGEIKSTFSK